VPRSGINLAGCQLLDFRQVEAKERVMFTKNVSFTFFSHGKQTWPQKSQPFLDKERIF
jgi:hypothetical protein